MRVSIFDIDDKGKAKITSHCKNIWYLNDIINRYGADTALKLFQVFDKCYDLNPNTNIFANIPESTKLETVLRATYPDIDKVVDIHDEVIEQAFDLIGELYTTPKYEAYKVIKTAYEKISTEVKFAKVDLSKEEGNVKQFEVAIKLLEDLGPKLDKAFEELEKEQGSIRYHGNKQRNDRRVGGKSQEL